MTKPISGLFRRYLVRPTVLAVLGMGPASAVLAAPATPATKVVIVEANRVADLVLLDGGFDVGLRPGMVCRVMRDNSEIAEILLVELRPTCSAALIMALTPKQSIRAGDLARIKILKP
ncbi:MAG: hypothetical protein EXS38_01875 [Opitutus sp.]|nr:hypothetical protein [Opitutus sp.]